MGIGSGDKSVLQQQLLVIVGTVVNEGLLVAQSPRHTPDFITSCHIVKTCFYLTKEMQSYTLNQYNQLRLNSYSILAASHLPARQGDG